MRRLTALVAVMILALPNAAQAMTVAQFLAKA